MTASAENSEQGVNWTEWLDASQKARDQRALEDIARDLDAEQLQGYAFVEREKVDQLLTSMGRLAGRHYDIVASGSTAITLLSQGFEDFETAGKEKGELETNNYALSSENGALREELEGLGTPVEGSILSEHERTRALAAVQAAAEVISLVPGHKELTKQLTIVAFALEGLTPSTYREVKEG